MKKEKSKSTKAIKAAKTTKKSQRVRKTYQQLVVDIFPGAKQDGSKIVTATGGVLAEGDMTTGFLWRAAWRGIKGEKAKA